MKYFFNYFEGIIFFKSVTYILNDHHEEGQLNAKGLVSVSWACNIVSRNVSSHDLED